MTPPVYHRGVRLDHIQRTDASAWCGWDLRLLDPRPLDGPPPEPDKICKTCTNRHGLSDRRKPKRSPPMPDTPLNRERRRIILDVITDAKPSGGISRTDIADVTGLRLADIGRIVSDLISARAIVDVAGQLTYAPTEPMPGKRPGFTRTPTLRKPPNNADAPTNDDRHIGPMPTTPPTVLRLVAGSDGRWQDCAHLRACEMAWSQEYGGAQAMCPPRCPDRERRASRARGVGPSAHGATMGRDFG